MRLLRERGDGGRQMTLRELQQHLTHNRNNHIKSKSELPLKSINNRALDIKQYAAGVYCFERPKPCRCPTHHKPSITCSRLLGGFKSKFGRAFDSEHQQTHQDENKLNCANSQYYGELSAKRIGQTTQTDYVQQDTENYLELAAEQARRMKELARKLAASSTRPPNGLALDERTVSKYLQHLECLKYKYSQATRYLNRKGQSVEDNPAAEQIAQEYLDKVFREMRQFEQVYRQLHKPKESVSPTVPASSLLNKKLQLNRKPTRNDKPSELQDVKQTGSKNRPMLEQILLENDQSISSKHSNGHPSISELQSIKEPTSSNSCKSWMRPKQHISLVNFLEDIDGEQAIEEIAHADRQELIEGLDFIERELNAQLFKCKTLKNVPEYIAQGKTHNLLERVLKTVEGSTRLTTNERVDRSELLQDGLRKIYSFETQIKNQVRQSTPLIISQATLTEASEDNEENVPSPVGKFSHKRSSFVRKGLAGIDGRTKQNETDLTDAEKRASNFRPKGWPNTFGSTQDTRLSGLSRVSQSSNEESLMGTSFGNRIFLKKSLAKVVAEATGLPIDLSINGSHKRLEQNATEGCEADQNTCEHQEDHGELEQNERTRSRNCNAKRRKGLNKMVMQDDLKVNYEADDQPSVYRQSVRRGTWNTKQMSDSVSDEQLRMVLAGNHRNKLRGLVKDINKCLADSKLEAFAIKVSDDDRTKHRKLHQLKILLQKKPELASTGLARNISQYEKEQTLFRMEVRQSSQAKQPLDDSIVLGTILSAILQENDLKWSDSIKTVERAADESDMEVEDFQKYLHEPLNSRSKEQQKLQACIRQQQQSEQKELQPINPDTLNQQELRDRTPYEDVRFWHRKHFRTENSPEDRKSNSEQLRKFVRGLRIYHPPKFQRLYESCFGEWC